MSPRPRVILAAIALLALAGAPARAQSVRGNLRDTERGHVIAGARLLLLTEAGACTSGRAASGRLRSDAEPSPRRAGAPVDSAVSDASGPREAGMLVGRVRSRPGGEGVGAVRDGRGDGRRRGSPGRLRDYRRLRALQRSGGSSDQDRHHDSRGVTDTTAVEIRAGTTAWYDLFVGRPRR